MGERRFKRIVVSLDAGLILNGKSYKGTTPSLSFIPKIIEFLGYAPYDASPKSPGEEITAARQLAGLSQEKLVRSLGINSKHV